MDPELEIGRYRITRIVSLVPRPDNEGPLLHAGDRPGAGIYREVERGIFVRLAEAIPLPDLNSYQPSRFLRRTARGGLLSWITSTRGSLDLTVLYEAGQFVPAGFYRDVERGVEIQLLSSGSLPDLQTGLPSRYRRISARKFRVRRPH
jgi:hypothetical protein